LAYTLRSIVNLIAELIYSNLLQMGLATAAIDEAKIKRYITIASPRGEIRSGVDYERRRGCSRQGLEKVPVRILASSTPDRVRNSVFRLVFQQ
jgi:hypothetical protein